MARPSFPARAVLSDPVHIGFRFDRQIVIDDVTHSIDIDSAGRDIRRHENFDAAILETVEGPGSCSLALVSRWIAAAEKIGSFQFFYDLVGGMFHLGEDDRFCRRVAF